MPKKVDFLIGAHMPITGGLAKSVERALELGCTTMQIFTKNNKSWTGKPIEASDAALFRSAVKKAGLEKIMAHSSYLINLAAKNPEIRKKSIASLTEELNRCELLGIPYLVLHPGAHVGQGEAAAIEKISNGLDMVFKKAPGTTKILLEIAAGQGTNVGYTFEQLRGMYDGCTNKKRVGICIDTCHAFSAGYDISSPAGYTKFWEDFRSILGTRLLKAIHLNDSKKKVGARLDRHEKIGKGTIPLATFKAIMNDTHLQGIPMVLETPIEKDYHEYKAEIELLKAMKK